MLNDLKEIIAIRSVLSDKQDGAPYGKGCKKALEWFLAKAQSYGLKTGQMDGHCGWAEYGEGEKCIAALCHLDVVPEGEGWSSDPYTLTVEDGKLFGRGVADDKGAAVMCLHALKEIKESGVRLTHRVRVIVGLNEEHGSACMAHYVNNGGEIPLMSFVPDSDFPVINSEKGILHLLVNIPLDEFFSHNVGFISGGQSINVIPDHASVSIFRDSAAGRFLLNAGNGEISRAIFSTQAFLSSILASGASADDFDIRTEPDVITIEAKGVAGHALAPHKADNAIWKIFTVLEALGDSEIAGVMNENFCTRLSCERLGIYKNDEESGSTTVSMGIIEVDDDSLSFSLDIRVPLSLKHTDAVKSIAALLPARSKVDITRWSPNLYMDKNSPLIKTLLEVYSEVTGNAGECLKSGGGTYARSLPNAVAFGPMFCADSCRIHKTDENMSVEDFHKAFEIYKRAFLRLAE